MTRSVLLPTTGDPFILRYWLRFYDKNIASVVDQTYIGQFGPTYQAQLDLIDKMCRDRSIIFSSDSSTSFYGAGESLNAAYLAIPKECNAKDSILLMESDVYIFEKSILDTHFNT